MRLPDLPGDWLMFVCAACGEETFVKVDLLDDRVTAEQMLNHLYGEPRICTGCQNEMRLAI